MRHDLQDRKATFASYTELVPLWSVPLRRNDQIAFISDLKARLEVSLIRKDLL